MSIPPRLVLEGPNQEFRFRDDFIIPLLIRLGYGVITISHGAREFGRDVVFGEIDRLGHTIFHAMQVKYEPSISQSASHSLIEDAVEATNNPFKHPATGRECFISCFLVATAGTISNTARENFFNTLARHGIRDARLLDGPTILQLDKAINVTRRESIQQRLAGMLQEIRRNRNVLRQLVPQIKAFAAASDSAAFPILRCRHTAAGAYLNEPFVIRNLDVDTVDQYWEAIRIVNEVADSVGLPLATANFRQQRAEHLPNFASQAEDRARLIESAIQRALLELSSDLL